MRTSAWKLPVALAALALSLFLTGALAAQPGDLLEETRAKMVIEAQRLEKVVSDAQKEAFKVGRKSPAEAVDILKSTLAQLEDDKALKPERREQLKRALRIALKDFEFEVSQRRAGLGSDPAPRLRQDEARRAEEERRKAQVADVNRSITDKKDQLAALNSIREERGRATTGVLTGVERSFSLIPPDGQMMFPKDWAEKMKSPHRGTGVKMTEKEKAIMATLNKVISTDFENNTFQDVMGHLEKLTGQSFIVDRQSMMDAGVTYEGTQITCKHKATLRTLLHKILGDVGLAYIVKDEVIQIVTPAKAKETLSTRTYSIADLLVVSGGRFGVLQTQRQAAAMINQIAVLITQVVEPDSWEVNGKGGLGTIAFEPITMSLIVRQTAEVHYQMGFGGR